jgi:predicted house-cleaning NTP pyrophosphatase (Maf/HAM1 superfamily)
MLFVEEIAGNYHNVMGLPPNLLARLARRFGVAI